ncbi:MAG: F0F1 ATP synthase subunit B [Dehalococcoidia bacterium]|nr:F0F1 ATP synthase subunit B [Dehalococcoidia bacterium]
MGLGLDLPAFIGQLVSFLLLVAILSHFGYRPIRRIMDERSARIRDSVESAEQARLDYERVRAQAEQELSDARQEARGILVNAGAARDHLLEEARAEAKQEALAIVDDARAQLGEERRAMVAELRRQFAEAAILAAESVVRETLDVERHRKLIDAVLDERLPLEEDQPRP